MPPRIKNCEVFPTDPQRRQLESETHSGGQLQRDVKRFLESRLPARLVTHEAARLLRTLASQDPTFAIPFDGGLTAWGLGAVASDSIFKRFRLASARLRLRGRMAVLGKQMAAPAPRA